MTPVRRHGKAAALLDAPAGTGRCWIAPHFVSEQARAALRLEQRKARRQALKTSNAVEQGALALFEIFLTDEALLQKLLEQAQASGQIVRGSGGSGGRKELRGQLQTGPKLQARAREAVGSGLGRRVLHAA